MVADMISTSFRDSPSKVDYLDIVAGVHHDVHVVFNHPDDKVGGKKE